jgi:hypothetical protein
MSKILTANRGSDLGPGQYDIQEATDLAYLIGHQTIGFTF